MSIIVEEQEDVTFTCTARGDPMPNITWSKENGPLPVGRFVVGLGSLSLSNVLRNDSGNYTCNAISAAGTILSSAELLVHSILKFTMESSGPFDIFTGDSLALPCSAESDPEPTMTWKFPNVSGVHIFVNNTLFIASAELSHTGMYMCQAENYFRILQQYINVHVYAYPSCHHIKTQQRLSSGGSTQADTSGVYFIDPDGGDIGEAPFQVFCNMSKGNGVTLVSHDSEARTLVDGHGPVGSYRRDVHYTGATLLQIVSLMSVSKSCRQFIKYECLRSALLKDATGYWVSRDGAAMQYWGGATPGSGMCACGEDKTCVSSGEKCNCDSKANDWQEDSGFLKDTSTLPVTQLRFGDTDRKNEQGYHTLGKLECHGRVEDSTDGTGM